MPINYQPSTINRPLNSWDLLKILALLIMVVDHSGIFFYPDQPWLRAVGRSGMPIFLFLAGYAASYRFSWRLFILALLISVSDVLLVGHVRAQNILFGILLCRMVLEWHQRRGRLVQRPYEWLAATLSLCAIDMFVMYGSFPLLFALCGYFKRHAASYARKTLRLFWALSFLSYGAMAAFLAGFSVTDTLIMTLAVAMSWTLLWHFRITPVNGRYWPRRALKLISRYSGEIYAFHLIALEWLTGVPF